MNSFLQKIFIVEGVLLGLLGILFFINPVGSLLNFTTIVGILIVITGVVRIFRGFKSNDKLYYILTGIIDILFGLFVWFNPIVTVENLILVYGIWSFIKGIYNIIIIVKNKYFGFNAPTILSILSVILGGIIIFSPIVILAALPYIPYIIGVYFIIVAVSEIYVGFKIN